MKLLKGYCFQNIKISIIVLILGSSIFLYYKAGFVFYSIYSRSQPVEVDDSYVYMWKAVTMNNGFGKDGQALNDLRKQVPVKSDDLKVIRKHWKVERTFFGNWHPLHSILLITLREIGIVWLDAYLILLLSGSLFICFSLIYWQVMMWGPMVSGISLIFIAPVLFKEHGLNIIVPTNIALGIGFLLWGRIIQAERKTWIALPICSLAAVLMHPIGKVYAAIGLGMYIYIVGRKPSWRNKFSILGTIVILAIGLLMPHFLERPLMEYGILNSNWIVGVERNINTAYGAVGSRLFYKKLYSGVIALIALFLALKVTDKADRYKIGLMGLLLGVLAFVSLLYVSTPRHYPALLYNRIWIPVVVFFLGACAKVCYIAVVDIILRWNRTFSKYKNGRI